MAPLTAAAEMANSHHHRHYLLTTFLLLLFMTTTTSAQTDPGDAAAMRALAASLGADETLGWSSATDPCSTWPHLYCSPSGGNRVTAVQIGNLTLSGTLPPTLRNLTALVRLELHSNRISGPLPSLAGISTLQHLLLHRNLFTSLPHDFFSGLTSLQSVYLDDNPFDPWEIPPSLADATSLVNFSANSANLTGGVPDLFAGLPSLSHLGLAFNLLRGNIPASFAGISSLRSLWLNNQKGTPRLSGAVDVVGNMTSLEQLWLQSNDFSGPLPDFSDITGLRDLDLRDNRFTGPVPSSLTSLASLRKVTLTNNLLQGPAPEFPPSVAVAEVDPTRERFCSTKTGEQCDPRVNALLAVMRPLNYPARFAEEWIGNDPCAGWLGIVCDGDGNITGVNFQRMELAGEISPDFASIASLERILLSGNNLTGAIPPSLVTLPALKVFDVSNNSLSGEIPTFPSRVQVNTMGNLNIGKKENSSSVLSGASGGMATPTGSANGTNIRDSSRKKSSLSSVGMVVGSVVGGICGAVVIGSLAICFYKRKQHPFGRPQNPNTTVIHPRYSGSEPESVKITIAGSSSNGGITTTSESNSPTSSGGSRRRDTHVVEVGNMVISIQVLRNVTNNFSQENVLGQGGFGTVYKGELHDGTKIAVKRMESGVMGSKGKSEFESEIAVLTKVRHRHLVSLHGYCLDENERLLVYEYVPQGTLSRHLFNWKEEGLKPLEWMRRLSIALDVARGVEYLHSLAQQSFIHRDLKPSNILLGDDMKAKVSDFGLVRLAPNGKCSIETRLAGTFGYLAPEYAVTGRVTTKADVFSFGVILMELITGRKALDENQPEESVHLVMWFRRMQMSKDTFRQSIDPAIDLDEETLASILTVSELAGHCCAREPYQRPDMGHAVNVLSSLAEQWKPTDPDAEENYGIDLDMTLPQALKKWQAFEGTQSDSATSSFLASVESSQTSIPTRPVGFADSFTSADGR